MNDLLVEMNKTLINIDFATDLPRYQESCVSIKMIGKTFHHYADTTFQIQENYFMR